MPLDSIIITPEAFHMPKNSTEYSHNEYVKRVYADQGMREGNRCGFKFDRTEDDQVYLTNVGWTREGFRVIATKMQLIDAVKFIAEFLEMIYPEEEPAPVVDVETILAKYEGGF
jgi:hypothetical protein